MHPFDAMVMVRYPFPHMTVGVLVSGSIRSGSKIVWLPRRRSQMSVPKGKVAALEWTISNTK